MMKEWYEKPVPDVRKWRKAKKGLLQNNNSAADEVEKHERKTVAGTSSVRFAPKMEAIDSCKIKARLEV